MAPHVEPHCLGGIAEWDAPSPTEVSSGRLDNLRFGARSFQQEIEATKSVSLKARPTACQARRLQVHFLHLSGKWALWPSGPASLGI